jgi:hypothetical protein
MEPVRVLRLGSSLDFSGELPPGTRAWEVAERRLSQAIDRPVTTTVKPVWPGARVPKLLESWLDELQPDIVLVVISSYWVETEVIANRVRRLPRLGQRIEKVSKQAATKPALADSRAYLLGRRVLLRTIGGAVNFTPAQLEEHVEAWLRVILRKESVAAAVAGTPFSPDTLATKRAQHRATVRKDELRSRLQALAGRLDIPCHTPPHAADAFDPKLRLSDRVHFNPAAHARMGEIDAAAMLQAWERAGVVR